MSPRHVNPSKEDEKERLANPGFDGVIALAVVFYAALWALFIMQVRTGGSRGVLLGGALVMGLMCGGVGINIGHELGHRRSRSANRVASSCLVARSTCTSSLSTTEGITSELQPRRPSELAPWGVGVCLLVRSVIGGFLSAWELEVNRCKRMNQRVWSLSNEMVRFVLAQAAWLVFLGLIGGASLLVAAVLASLAGILLLETSTT